MDSFVIRMRYGPLLPVAVVLWIVQAYDRGLRFRLVGNRLDVEPPGALAAEDERFLRLYPLEVRDAVDYVQRVAARPIQSHSPTEAAQRRETFWRAAERSRQAGARTTAGASSPRG